MEISKLEDEKLDAYEKRAKESWGDTSAYREYAEKHRGRTRTQEKALGGQLMEILAVFGTLQSGSPSAPESQAQVQKLQDFITAQYYTCSKPILSQLGRMYADGGAFTANIDRAGGQGTAAFANRAIQIYCGKE